MNTPERIASQRIAVYGTELANNVLVDAIRRKEASNQDAALDRAALKIVADKIDRTFCAFIVAGGWLPTPSEVFYNQAEELSQLIGDCRDLIERHPVYAPMHIRNAAGTTVAKITDRNTVIRY